MVGRLAAVARIIRAKNDPGFLHDQNMVIVNAESAFTGRRFYRHQRRCRNCKAVFQNAFWNGLLNVCWAKYPLRASRMKNVRIYKGEHHHQAHHYTDIGAWNEKNKKRSRQEW